MFRKRSRNIDQNNVTDLNPFFKEPEEVPPDPIIEVDLRYKSRVKNRQLPWRIYQERLQSGAHSFPWFFEYPFATAEDIVFALGQRNIQAIRRVLVSLLGGRPMKAVAQRVPVSRSAVYKTLNWLYFSSDLRDWTSLGLVRVWDVPVPSIDINTIPDGYYVGKETSPTVCLICHSVLHHVPLNDQRRDCSLVETPREGLEENNNLTDRIRGHLIAHFPMFGRPKVNDRVQYPMFFDDPRGTPRPIANRWIDLLPEITVAIANMQRSQTIPLLPNGKLSEIEVRKFYRDLLLNPELGVKERGNS